MQAFHAVFGSQHHVLWWQECLRALLMFAYGLVLMRSSGRRTFGRWSALDIVVSIILGSSLSRALTGSAPLGGTMAAMAVMIGLHWVLARAAAQSRKLAGTLEGEPIALVQAGRRNEPAMRHFSVSAPDLEEALHGAGIMDIAEARLALLEPSGKITVLKQG
ncbi:MAG TPA: YetF domain-containing protein [Acetobacteraceae bacterium]|nr:YetF domain-containing protein [Acetobacteraceae bacterium]